MIPGSESPITWKKLSAVLTRQRHRNSCFSKDVKAAQKKVGLSKIGRGYL